MPPSSALDPGSASEQTTARASVPRRHLFSQSQSELAPRRLTSEPTIQFLTGGPNISSLLSDWHSFVCPSLRERNWLAEERGNLLPAFEHDWFRFSLLALRHGASTMLSAASGLQSWLAILVSNGC